MGEGAVAVLLVELVPPPGLADVLPPQVALFRVHVLGVGLAEGLVIDPSLAVARVHAPLL